MSASKIAAVAPSSLRANARFTDVVDLPTPPLPEAIAIIFLMPLILSILY